MVTTRYGVVTGRGVAAALKEEHRWMASATSAAGSMEVGTTLPDSQALHSVLIFTESQTKTLGNESQLKNSRHKKHSTKRLLFA
jgi:hypothetical protein